MEKKKASIICHFCYLERVTCHFQMDSCAGQADYDWASDVCSSIPSYRCCLGLVPPASTWGHDNLKSQQRDPKGPLANDRVQLLRKLLSSQTLRESLAWWMDRLMRHFVSIACSLLMMEHDGEMLDMLQWWAPTGHKWGPGGAATNY